MENPTLAGKIYLDILYAEGYPEQEPEYQSARWYHLLYLLVPIMGILLFTQAVRASYNRK